LCEGALKELAGDMPSSAKEFREFAQECLRGADDTKSERHCQVLLNMAKTLTQDALRLERGLALFDDVPLRHKPKRRPAK
jgi:hypothetical protein